MADNRRFLSTSVANINRGGGGSAIKSIQHGSITTTGTSATGTATISAVNTSNSIVIFEGSEAGDNGPNSDSFYVTLTNSTTVTATRSLSTTNVGTIYFTVIEWESGIVKSIQNVSGVWSGSGGAINITISSVTTTKAVVFRRGMNTSTATNTAGWQNSNQRFQFTSSTNLEAWVSGVNGTSATGYFTVVEFN